MLIEDIEILSRIRAVGSIHREATGAAQPVNRDATATLLLAGAWRFRCADPL
jgi:hypothetical protein